MRRSSLMLLWLVLFLSGVPMQAQQSGRPLDTITIDTDLVVTWAQITNRSDGATVRGLGAKDFVLQEGGQQQLISLVTQDQPLSVVFLVDAMACWHPRDWEFQRARQAMRMLGDDAEIALMAWDSHTVLMQPLTLDRDVIVNQLQDKASFIHAVNPPGMVRQDGDGYRPGEAIFEAATYLEKAASRGRRRVIITVMGGYGPPVGPLALYHWRKAKEVSELLEKTGTTVFGLYLPVGPSRQKTSSLMRWINAYKRSEARGGTLEQFVEQTGGTILVGKTEEPDEWLIRLTGLIRSGYSIGYYPADRNFDGRFRRIKLALSREGKKKTGDVNIKTAGGYRALRPPSRVVSERIPKL